MNEQERSSQGQVTGDLLRRVRRLEAAKPRMAAGDAVYPTEHSVWGWWLRPYTDHSQGNEAFGSPTYDAAAPFGAYISSIGATQANAEEGIYFGLGPLGPRTSWGVDLIMRQGPDSGKVIVEFGTTPVDEQGWSLEVGYPPPGIGTDKSIVTPYQSTGIGSGGGEFSGWWQADTAFTGIDLYSAVNTDWEYWPWYSFSTAPFWVLGDDGSMLTAHGQNGPVDAANQQCFITGGGDQAWWMRIRANGKNASSSGYGFRLAGFRMYRQNGDGDIVT